MKYIFEKPIKFILKTFKIIALSICLLFVLLLENFAKTIVIISELIWFFKLKTKGVIKFSHSFILYNEKSPENSKYKGLIREFYQDNL